MERKAANYIARQMREAGATVELYEIDAYISFPARCDGRGSQPRASHYQGQRFRSGCSRPLPKGLRQRLCMSAPADLIIIAA